MKSLLIALLLALIPTSIFAQKAKIKSGSSTITSTLATFENLKAEIITEEGKQKLVISIENAGKKENVILKELITKDKNQFPMNVKINSFTVSGVKLYHFSYTENIKTETKLKKEDALVTTNEIWDFSSTKVKILSNIQTISKIKETVFLDKNKTASEEVEKTRKEGFEFTLTKDYEVILSTKTQTNKYKFNPITRRYDPKK
ncbi:hypothetical protein [Flavobacterium sp.]|jgi:hypothetical protein|uniref:hypothetical protein n=2 Tax=Flavobacterium sp. TaxID=239 RepID=UPI0037C16D9A